MSYCSIQAEGKNVVLRLQGHWTVFALPAIEGELAAAALQSAKRLTVDGKTLESFDTSAAWCLNVFLARLKKTGAVYTFSHFGEAHRKIFEMVASLPPEEVIDTPAALGFANLPRRIIAGFGEKLVAISKDTRRWVSLFGQFVASFPPRLFNPRRLRLQSVVFHINEIGIKAIPIITLMAFSIAFVMGYQGAFQLQKFDATVYTIDLVVLSILREMGVLITAIMVAGRSGSAFAAQLGTMKLNEEVDALRTMGVSPFEVLVLPRLIAILIALPLLTIVADMLGLFGGYVFSVSYLDYSRVQFFARMEEAVDMTQFYVGLSKAPVFALLIGIVGCMQGLQAQGSAEDVGRKTITAVVQSIFLVIVADAIFSVIFTKLGI